MAAVDRGSVGLRVGRGRTLACRTRKATTAQKGEKKRELVLACLSNNDRPARGRDYNRRMSYEAVKWRPGNGSSTATAWSCQYCDEQLEGHVKEVRKDEAKSAS